MKRNIKRAREFLEVETSRDACVSNEMQSTFLRLTLAERKCSETTKKANPPPDNGYVASCSMHYCVGILIGITCSTCQGYVVSTHILIFGSIRLPSFFWARPVVLPQDSIYVVVAPLPYFFLFYELPFSRRNLAEDRDGFSRSDRVPLVER